MNIHGLCRGSFASNKAAAILASGGIVALLSHQYSTTLKRPITDLQHATPEHFDTNDATERPDKTFNTSNVYKPKLPYPEWDDDWDNFRQRCNTDTASERVNTERKLPARHLLLIRHGQYEQGSSDDKQRFLTELGKRQAKFTGQRLGAMMNTSSIDIASKGSETTTFSGPCFIKSIHVSNMTRAKETAEVIANELSACGHDVVITKPDGLLNEGLPATIIPTRPDVGSLEELAKEIHENHDRIEEAFQKYFYRLSPSQYTNGTSCDHEFEIIVCHANVIRYFVMRALQLPPEAWLRLSLFNCSITYLIVQPNGYVTARMIGDTGHIPYEETTFSGSFGYNWVGPPSVAK